MALATCCHAHRYLGSFAPRSGLSRSDFVQWPDSDDPAAGHGVGSLGRSRRRLCECYAFGRRGVDAVPLIYLITGTERRPY